MKRNILLGTDAVVNLLLGAVLVAFPARLIEALGIPTTDSAFYPSILGAVTVNLCGGIVLAVWLVAGGLDLPTRGLILLWLLVVVLVGLSGLELWTQAGRRGQH